jgi:hypothetical protein
MKQNSSKINFKKRNVLLKREKRKLYIRDNITFISLSVEAKNLMQKEVIIQILVHLETKRVSMKQNEKFMKQNKAKNGIFISFLLDAKILMRKEANNYFLALLQAKRSYRFVSLRFASN